VLQKKSLKLKTSINKNKIFASYLKLLEESKSSDGSLNNGFWWYGTNASARPKVDRSCSGGVRSQHLQDSTP
jgi:hypothetical protein